MSEAKPVVDVAEKTVTHAGLTFIVRPLSEDSYTVLVRGIPVGRIVFSFGAVNAIVEVEEGGETVSEDVLWEVGEAWFAAIES